MMFPKILEGLMQSNDLTIGKLSSELGVSKSTLHGYLQGASPSLANLLRISEFFKVSVDYLIKGEEPQGNSLDPIEQFLKVQVHEGLYEVSIKKVVKK